MKYEDKQMVDRKLEQQLKRCVNDYVVHVISLKRLGNMLIFRVIVKYDLDNHDVFEVCLEKDCALVYSCNDCMRILQFTLQGDYSFIMKRGYDYFIEFITKNFVEMMLDSGFPDIYERMLAKFNN